MFLLDGEKLNIQGTKAAKEGSIEYTIKQAKKELENAIGYPVTFRIARKFTTVTEEGLIEKPGMKRLSPTVRIEGSDGTQYLTYCERFIRDSEGNAEIYPRKITFSDTLILDKNQWELAVFMYKFCKNSKIEMLDPKGDHRKLNQERKDQSKVSDMIYNPELHGLSQEDLTQIAMSYGINTVGVDIAIIQNMLFDLIKTQQEASKTSTSITIGYKGFIESAKLNELTYVRANVYKAIEIGKIKAFREYSQTWAYVAPTGEMGLSITQYNDEFNKHEELAQFFIQNQAKYIELINVLGKDALQREKRKSNPKAKSKD